jgi:hypothetical protein
MSSSGRFLLNTPHAITGRPSTSSVTTQISSSRLAILAFFGPVTHSAHVNTVITTKNLHSAVSFNSSDSFDSQKFNHSTLLTAHWRVHSAGFHFTHNSNKTSSHSNLPPTEVKEQML